MDNFYIRKMQKKDILTIYENIHLSYIEKYYPDEKEKKWQEHQRWYEFMLNSNSYVFYICEDEKNNFISTIRFEIEDEKAIVSIYIKESFRNKNLAKPILKKAMDLLKNELTNINLFLAYILAENQISIKIFEDLGFKYVDNDDYNGVEHLLYEYILDGEHYD